MKKIDRKKENNVSPVYLLVGFIMNLICIRRNQYYYERMDKRSRIEKLKMSKFGPDA